MFSSRARDCLCEEQGEGGAAAGREGRGKREAKTESVCMTNKLTDSR